MKQEMNIENIQMQGGFWESGCGMGIGVPAQTEWRNITVTPGEIVGDCQCGQGQCYQQVFSWERKCRVLVRGVEWAVCPNIEIAQRVREGIYTIGEPGALTIEPCVNNQNKQ